MNAPTTRTSQAAPTDGPSLLDIIVEVHGQVGDGLTDQDLTCLLNANGLPTDAGFAFLSFSDHCATLSVPPQDLADWYLPTGWIAPEKERLATAIATKYQLALWQPPDHDVGVFPRLNAPPVRHHLELANAGETVIAVHPRYLRIRLFAALPGIRHLPGVPLLPVPRGPSLLQDLSSLYRGGVARTAPRRPGWSQLRVGQTFSPDPGNLGELGRASSALGEEWTQMSEQPWKPTAGPAENGSRSPSRHVLHNQA